MNELKLQNDLEYALTTNEIVESYFNCNTTELRLILLAIATELKDNKENVNKEVSFSFADYKKIMGLEKTGKKQKTEFIKSVKNCSSLQISLKSPDNLERTFLNWFSYAKMNEKTNMVYFKFNDDVFNSLKALKSYIQVNFSIISKIQSPAIRYYMLLKSYRYKQVKTKWNYKTWEPVIEIDELRKLFNISADAYKGRTDNFILKVVKKPIESLNKINTEFQTSFVKLKEGKSIKAIKFTCSELTAKKAIQKNDSPEKKQLLTDVNNEQAEIAAIKKQNPDLWEKIFNDKLDKVRASNAGLGESSIKTFAEIDTFEEIKKLLPENKQTKKAGIKSKKKITKTTDELLNNADDILKNLK